LCLVIGGPEASLAQPITLVALGDSLTEGAGDSEYDDEGRPLGYPGRVLQALLPEYPGSELYNLGRSGWTTEELINGTTYDGTPGQLGEAVSELEAALGAGHKAFALLWTGSNDLWAVYEWKCDTTSPPSCAEADAAEYRSNLSILLSELTATGANVVVALLDDHSRRPIVADPAYADSFPEITPEELPLLSAQVDRYNAIIAELANANGAQTVDFYHTTLFEQAATLSEDGNHPNAAGYDQAAAIWLEGVTRPRTDILANGWQGPLAVSPGDTIDLSLNLAAERAAGTSADWFLVQVTPSAGVRSYSLATGSFEDGLFASYQGQAFDLNLLLTTDTVGWEAGAHTLYFGVDLTMDAVLSVPSYYDWVKIDIR
jgi:lysophospholipase L1-like esterase